MADAVLILAVVAIAVCWMAMLGLLIWLVISTRGDDDDGEEDEQR